jgi:hypothetical protein
MKRIFLGLALLLALLGIAAVITVRMDRVYEPITNALRQAAEAAEADDWKKAAFLADQAKTRWEEQRRFTATVADHSPMDEIDGLFAELEIYLRQQEMPHFAATCRHLSMLTEAMGDNHALNLWNLL